VTSLSFILACVVLAVGFFVAGAAWASIRARGRDWQVTVGRAADSGRELQHLMSAQLRHREKVVHFERVDLREDGYEEKLAVAVAEMKHKLATIEAAQRIALEP
jgi:hypothetical protein